MQCSDCARRSYALWARGAISSCPRCSLVGPECLHESLIRIAPRYMRISNIFGVVDVLVIAVVG
jgi:hypothetical protein